MYRPNSVLLLVGLAICAVALAGCPGATTKTVLDTEPVQGVVTLDGTPVPGATVTFVPVTAGQGMSATGVTDASGVYKLTALGRGETTGASGAGTLPGEYHVGVVKTETETPMSQEEAEEKGVPYVPPTPGEDLKVTYVVPQKYNNPKESGLKFTVKEGSNDIPIELSSQ